MLTRDALAGSVPIHLAYEDDLESWRRNHDELTATWLNANAFKGERNKVVVTPDSSGRPKSVIAGMGKRSQDLSCWHSAGLPDRLPDGAYHLADSLSPAAATQFAFGWAYGEYRFERYKRASTRSVSLRIPEG